MTTNEIITLNKIIGKALVETAHEAYLKRLNSMLSTPFEEVINAIKNRKLYKNKYNGFYITDAVSYFDNLLEKEHEEIWLDVDTCDSNWYKAIENFFKW